MRIVFLALLVAASAAQAAPGGTVARLRGQATEETGGITRVLHERDNIEIGARLRTGAGARIEVRLIDGTDLTLGESAVFTIDELAMTTTTGTALFTRAAGAFRMVAGAISTLADHRIEVTSDVGTIGIRGTDVWGGAIQGRLDVFLVEGLVEVSDPAGSVLLSLPGSGTHIRSPDSPPDDPIQWPAALAAQALASTSFDSP